ncbi:DUF3040 domain-containing protein [Dactylosporangium vinaceum]|uniref:DUF3040 domain-containing protein n=1 Tax=Dactylosporangium vinaceum TaxID=53362 RepID=A0ABV5MFJ7_9ACTN|nr:DUF3040 domain-containing protein [Dactylosporangium vinaceum]UAB98769.1 DUF3040 domain-containing protein [Dactylosporangium vinaceum]
MLSESEQKRLADIEAALQSDTRFVNGFNRALTRRITPRRVISVTMAIAAVVGVIIGLAAGSVFGTVLALCAIGVAGGVWTYRSPHTEPPAPQITPDH